MARELIDTGKDKRYVRRDEQGSLLLCLAIGWSVISPKQRDRTLRDRSSASESLRRSTRILQ
jgi:hypothetical protein